MKFLVLSLLFAGSVWAAPYISDGVVRGGGQAPLFKNFAPNPFAEKNVLGWTASGSMAVARDTDAADKLNGVASFELNPSAAETFTSTAMTLDNAMTDCEASVWYKGNASTWDFALVANDGTTVLTEVGLKDTSIWAPAALTYPCASGYKLQMQSDDGTNTINVGEFYWGKNTHLTSATPVTGWTAYTPTFDASFGTVTNKNFEWKQIGDTLFVRGSFTAGTTTTGLPTISLPAGLTLICSPGVTISSVVRNSIGEWNRSASSANTGKSGAVICRADTTGSVALSHEDYAIASDPYGSPNTNAIFATGESGSVDFSVKISQWASSQTAVTVENTDTEWATCSTNPSINNTATCVWTQTCKWRRDGDSVEIMMNATTGAAACTGSGTVTIGLPNSLNVNASKLTSRQTVGGWYNGLSGRNGEIINEAINNSFLVTDAATTVISSDIGANASLGFNWKLPISGWTKTASAPLLVGSVTSNSSGLERVEHVTFGTTSTTSCTASPCAYVSQSGSWVTSVTRGGTGSYTVNFATGIFSSPPTCTLSSNQFTAGTGNASTSSIVVACYNSAAVATDCIGKMICMGPR